MLRSHVSVCVRGIRVRSRGPPPTAHPGRLARFLVWRPSTPRRCTSGARGELLAERPGILQSSAVEACFRQFAVGAGVVGGKGDDLAVWVQGLRLSTRADQEQAARVERRAAGRVDCEGLVDEALRATIVMVSQTVLRGECQADIKDIKGRLIGHIEYRLGLCSCRSGSRAVYVCLTGLIRPVPQLGLGARPSRSLSASIRC
jgi:hypothetical protein